MRFFHTECVHDVEYTADSRSRETIQRKNRWCRRKNLQRSSQRL